jgi:hypothetical protein
METGFHEPQNGMISPSEHAHQADQTVPDDSLTERA